MPERKQPERKPFFKMFSREWLEGSIRFDCDSGERGVFIDLISLANESRARGIIQANPTTPYPHTWIASRLNISPELLDSCLHKFTQQGRIHENTQGIEVLNFAFYQEKLYPKRGRPRKYEKLEEQPLPEQVSASETTPKPPQKSEAKVPYQDILNSYHENCLSMPKVERLTDMRRTLIKARYHDFPDLARFEELFKKAAASDFLSGRIQSDRTWRCNFDWLLKSENMVRVLEGNYDNKPATQGKRLPTSEELDKSWR